MYRERKKYQDVNAYTGRIVATGKQVVQAWCTTLVGGEGGTVFGVRYDVERILKKKNAH